MKNSVLLLFLFLTVGVVAQNQNTKVKYQQALWPVKGKRVGSGIISKPGETINEELNYGELFIMGNEGDTVVVPVNGIIGYFGYRFRERLTLSNMMGFDKKMLENKTEAGVRKELAEGLLKHNRLLKGNITRYVSLTVSIITREGDVYYIGGLNYVKSFKTGEKVAKGDVVGTMGYAFNSFGMPHIDVSRSVANKSADPMSVFGLKTTFQKISAKNFDIFKDTIPLDSLKQAFSIIRTSLEEIHPGLYDYTSKREMDSLFDVTEIRLKPMTGRDFSALVKPIIRGIADSHTRISYEANVKRLPPVYFVYDGGKAVVVRASSKVNLKRGDVISKVGGKRISDWITYFKSTLAGFEGYNRLYIDRYLAEDLSTAIYKEVFPNEKPLLFSTTLGKNVLVPYTSVADYMKLRNGSKQDTPSFSFKMIKPDVAMLSVSTFVLTEVEIDSIEAKIAGLDAQKVRKLIVDVRDNSGGSIDGGNRILSYFLDMPLRVFAYRMVKSNSTYATLNHSDNWSAARAPFPYFESVEGREGFFCYTMEDSSGIGQIIPSKKTHYSGKLYVLTNEKSVSMASDFAGALLGQSNCTLVGRETGSSYYQMNAEKFANILLPQVGLTLRIPMVKVVLHDTPNPRIPYGRGVIPNYNVPIGAREFVDGKDVILEKTLELIAVEK